MTDNSNPPNQKMQARKRTTGEKSRRHRTILACDLCRAKKYKCDGHLPCMHCRRRGIECIFHLTDSDTGNVTDFSIASVGELKKKLDAAEAVIRNFEKVFAENQSPNSTASTYSVPYEAGASSSIVKSQNLPPQSVTSNAPAPVLSSIGGARQDQGADEANPMNSEELMDINSQTKNFEFHGKTSVIALFNGLHKEQQSRASSQAGSPAIDPCERQRSIVNEFHNEHFLGQPVGHDQHFDISREETFALNAFLFIDAYFKTLHFVHPILDQAWFMKRCNDLWTGRTHFLRPSFLALYFSVLSLGACVRIWTETSINGMNRLEWSRLLFEKAEHALGRNGSVNDLEAVQAPFMLALICQQQLELNLAYAFLGRAIRTAFSTGINRKVEFANRNFPQDSPNFTVGRTWWELYNLEIELSFTLGRPDTLGFESYHNRPLPPIDDTENVIIPVTHQLSHIIRKVSAEIYLSRARPEEKLRRALQIESELDQWLNNLPLIIRPPSASSVESLQNSGNMRSPYWPRLQMLTLKIRYLHVKVILFYLFFIHREKLVAKGLIPADQIYPAVEKCRSAARDMIKVLHWTYRMHYFYRTWGHNTTYIALGLLVFLSDLAQESPDVRKSSPHIEYINQSLEVLDTIEECSVAHKIGHFVADYSSSLLGDSTEAKQQQVDQSLLNVPGLPFTDFATFLQGYNGDYQIDPDTFDFFEHGLSDPIPQ
ncbi:hypothetical protein BT63DRAFT_112372 [Microthyrium microscopicum]|uniref:Zn(2)-C6 fungal-type domain-containing protein n=1 Tax=Microthyrium microscopicum TaxID=703497 RepID=A0A6A6TXA8_9PEZI|nr:hypothetical protein BT63DRAFT_112372 [Microthyrium microscopicum]